MHRLIRDIIAHHSVKFAIVGALGTLFNLAIMAFLVEQAKLSPLPASAAATELSIVHNFLLNNGWTFASRIHRSSMAGRFARFHLVALLGLVVNVAAAHLLMRFGLWYLTAQAFGIFIAWFTNYLAANRLVFPEITPTKPASHLDTTD